MNEWILQSFYDSSWPEHLNMYSYYIIIKNTVIGKLDGLRRAEMGWEEKPELVWTHSKQNDDSIAKQTVDIVKSRRKRATEEQLFRRI